MRSEGDREGEREKRDRKKERERAQILKSTAAGQLCPVEKQSVSSFDTPTLA